MNSNLNQKQEELDKYKTYLNRRDLLLNQVSKGIISEEDFKEFWSLLEYEIIAYFKEKDRAFEYGDDLNGTLQFYIIKVSGEIKDILSGRGGKGGGKDGGKGNGRSSFYSGFKPDFGRCKNKFDYNANYQNDSNSKPENNFDFGYYFYNFLNWINKKSYKKKQREENEKILEKQREIERRENEKLIKELKRKIEKEREILVEKIREERKQEAKQRREQRKEYEIQHKHKRSNGPDMDM